MQEPMSSNNREEAVESSQDFTFCPNCGKILVPSIHSLNCTKCGYTIEGAIGSKKAKKIIKEKKIRSKETQIDETKESWHQYFPYIEVRPLQEDIIKTINAASNQENHSIIQAANGVGKTIAILASLLPIIKKKKKTIVYCCRTHQQMSRVISELNMIKQLTSVSGIALRGRREICLHPLVKKFAFDSGNASEICNFLKEEGKCKFFTRLSDKKIIEKVKTITEGKVLDSDELLEIGKSLEVCPLEISTRLLAKVDVVACSYQYIFNPRIQNSFLTSLEKELSEIILVIDEAHNLPSTAVDISSATLSNSTISNAQSEATKYKMGEVFDILEALEVVLIKESEDLANDDEMRIETKDFIKKVEKRSHLKIDSELVKSIVKLGEQIKRAQVKQNRAPFSYISIVDRYLTTFIETKDRNDYAHFVTKVLTQRGTPVPKLLTLCLDPRSVTEELLANVHCSISASGTLDPIEAYVSLVGMNPKKVESIALPSPYKEENHITLVVDKLSSKLEDRIPANYSKMLELIQGVVKTTPKNVGIFCASYSVMSSLLEMGLERMISKPLYTTHKGMPSLENDKLIMKFKNESKKSGGVLISVLGGRSSEGSDYPSGEMHTVIIVGIPYAKPCPTIDASIEYLESQFPTKGREYGYNIPALTRAAQAAGRPIRSLEDYASIVLMDYRFARFYYKKHLPIWLKQNMSVVQPEPEDVITKVDKFFNFHRT